MRARFVLAFLLSIAALLATGCGGHHHHPKSYATRAPAAKLTQLCPQGHAFMGCSIARPAKGVKLTFGRPPGCIIPDSSNNNASVNYYTAKRYICGAILKLGEGSFFVDGTYAPRLAVLRTLHLWHAPYWFVRGGNCTVEGNAILSALRATGGLDSGPLVLDVETLDAAGMTVCLAQRVYAVYHRWAIIYTAPGTWPGGASGNLKAWIATYGNSHGCLPWTCSFLAWQFAAPPWVYFYIPGLGYGDVSVDQGLTSLVPPHVVVVTDPYHYRVLTATERNVTLHYDGARPHPQRYANYLKHTLEPELLAFAHTIWVLHAKQHNSWSYRNRGTRFQVLWHRGRGQLIRTH